jgi:ribonuclease P protein component
VDKPFAFPPREHLRRAADFRTVYERRRSVADSWLIVYGCENHLSHPRLGLSVSRKVGPAVVRNRIRRLYREAYRLSRPTLPVGVDLIVIPRTNREPTLEQLRESLPRLVQQVVRRLTPRDAP